MRKLAIGATVAAVLTLSVAARSEIRSLWERTKAPLLWTAESGSAPPFRPNEVVLTPANWRGSRIYLFAGLHNGADMWSESLYRPLVERLQTDGWQVVLMDSPDTKARYFDDDGVSYCRALLSWIDKTDRRLDGKSPARRKAVLGISFGGYQAMMAASRLPWVQSYVAMSPVTRIDALDEFWFQNNDRCSPFADADRIAKKPGLITFGTDERRVNSGYIAEIARKVQAHEIVYPGRVHVTVGDEYEPAARWLSAEI